MPKTRKKSPDPEPPPEPEEPLALPEPEPAPASPKPSWLQRMFTPGRLSLAALLMSGPFLGPLAWRYRDQFIPDISTRAEYRLASNEIQVTEPPHWVPEDLVEQTVVLAGLPQKLSLLDDDLAAQVAQAFALHPWVEEVKQVRKSIPSKVEVDLIYRRPAAMVPMATGAYPVDPKGVLLPPADFSPADAARYPSIRGIRSTPQGQAGTSWGDPLVIGAASLADILAPRWKEFALAAIDVPAPAPGTPAGAAAADGIYILTTDGGSKIIWGRAPGSVHPGELTAKLKLERLDEYLARFGGFDQPHGPYEIDIRHFREITRRPLTAVNPNRAPRR